MNSPILMNPLILSSAILCGLALAAVATSLFAVFGSKAMIRSANDRVRDAQTQFEEGIQAMRQTVEGLAAQVQDVQQQSRAMVAPGLPKPGLNLTKRSQALRMHRRGDSPAQIAATLEIPLQEVDLLIKVHRIVLGAVA
jgi:TolA-binding protein